MIKFNGLNLKDLKITDMLPQVFNGKKIAIGSEIVWEKSGGVLPSGYTQVKYLQSSGTQYIDTSIKSTFYSTVKLKYQGNERDTFFFGARNETARGMFAFFGGYSYLQGKFGLRTTANKSITLDTDHELLLDNTGFYVDGILIEALNQSNFSCLYNAYLFTVNNMGSPFATLATGKVYSYEFIENDIPTLNFIPCLDTNNTPCFYDTITQQTFYNAGTGTFGYETMDGTIVAPT